MHRLFPKTAIIFGQVLCQVMSLTTAWSPWEQRQQRLFQSVTHNSSWQYTEEEYSKWGAFMEWQRSGFYNACSPRHWQHWRVRRELHFMLTLQIVRYVGYIWITKHRQLDIQTSIIFWKFASIFVAGFFPPLPYKYFMKSLLKILETFHAVIFSKKKTTWQWHFNDFVFFLSC